MCTPSLTLLNLAWEECAENPLIQPGHASMLIADPTFLPPAETPDGRWHLCAHSLTGIHHYVSADGLAWEERPGLLVRGGLRPFLSRADERYYLFYERLLRLFPLHTCIEARESTDLNTWGPPVAILKPTLAWQREGGWRGTVGNPCVLADADGRGYRLYFSAGLAFLRDCKFYEPKYVGVALSQALLGPYTVNPRPLLAPQAQDPWANLGAGSLKVIQTADGYVGFQNGIYWDRAISHSRSAIRILCSGDGQRWTAPRREPILQPGRGWKHSHVYAMDVRAVQDTWMIYFNARDGWVFGRERIGRAVGRPVARARPRPS